MYYSLKKKYYFLLTLLTTLTQPFSKQRLEYQGQNPCMRNVCVTYAVCKYVTFSTFSGSSAVDAG